MPPQANPPAAPGQPPAPPAPAPAAGGTEDRLKAVEAEQARQGGLLEQILDRLPGKTPAGGGQGAASGPAEPAAGKSVAEQVREGIEALERERAAAAEGQANKTAREDHAARLAALEERLPKETAATPVGAFKAKVQRVMFGIDQ